MIVTTTDLKQIVKLSKKSITELRKMNKSLDRAYIGKELTKYELIYQIVFLRDAPITIFKRQEQTRKN